MPTVTMTMDRWQQLMGILGRAEGPGLNWTIINPLLMEIGRQLQAQQGNSQEIPATIPTHNAEDIDMKRSN